MKKASNVRGGGGGGAKEKSNEIRQGVDLGPFLIS